MTSKWTCNSDKLTDSYLYSNNVKKYNISNFTSLVQVPYIHVHVHMYSAFAGTHVHLSSVYMYYYTGYFEVKYFRERLSLFAGILILFEKGK